VSGPGPDVLTTRMIVGQLASPSRLRVVAALALGARSPSEIADRAQLSEEEANAALTRLLKGGLVTVAEGQFILREQAFADAARAGRRPGRLRRSAWSMRRRAGSWARTFATAG